MTIKLNTPHFIVIFVFKMRLISKNAGDSAVTKADKIINVAGAVAVLFAGLYFVPLSLFILMG